MASSFLEAPELTADQNNKAATVNAAVARLDAGTQGALGNTALSSETPTANTWVLTESEFLGNFFFEASGGAAAMTLQTQGETSSVVATKRFFAVSNADATYDLTINSDGAGTTVTLSPGEVALLYQNADDIIAVGEPTAASSVTIPYDIGIYFPGSPTTSQVLAEVFVLVATTIPDDFAGSAVRVGTNPTATWVLDIAVNGTAIGDVSISTGGVGTFTTDMAALSLSAGDRITVTAPASVDATAADLTLGIKGTVT